jgi:hypothetical protein
MHPIFFSKPEWPTLKPAHRLKTGSALPVWPGLCFYRPLESRARFFAGTIEHLGLIVGSQEKARALVEHFGSIDLLSRASVEQLQTFVPRAKALRLISSLRLDGKLHVAEVRRFGARRRCVERPQAPCPSAQSR